MPKLKTNRSARKRFKVTGTGKIKRRKAYARHLMTSKSPKRKRQLGQSVVIHKSDEKRISGLLKV